MWMCLCLWLIPPPYADIALVLVAYVVLCLAFVLGVFLLCFALLALQSQDACMSMRLMTRMVMHIRRDMASDVLDPMYILTLPYGIHRYCSSPLFTLRLYTQSQAMYTGKVN